MCIEIRGLRMGILGFAGDIALLASSIDYWFIHVRIFAVEIPQELLFLQQKLKTWKVLKYGVTKEC